MRLLSLLLCFHGEPIIEPQLTNPVAVISGPAQAFTGDLIRIDGSKSIGSDHKWELVGTNKTFFAIGNTCIFASGVQCEVTFILAVAKGDKVSLAKHTVKIIPESPGPGPGPGPQPPPGPGPNPPNPPGPTAERKDVFIVIADDYKKRTPEIAKVLTSEKLRKKVAEMNSNLVIFDVSQDLDERNNYGPWISEHGGPPVVIIQNKENGKVVKAFKLPDSEEKMLTEIAR